jgi:hypothetical protein
MELYTRSATFVIAPIAPAATQFSCPNRAVTVTTPPASGAQVVAISGAFTHFGPATTVTFGANITMAANPVSLVDATRLVVHIQSITVAAAPGWRQGFVNTAAANEQLTIGFLIDDSTASAKLSSGSPSCAAQGRTITATITATTVLQVAPTTPPGPRTAHMITGSEIVSGPLFSVTPGIASLLLHHQVQAVSVGRAAGSGP